MVLSRPSNSGDPLSDVLQVLGAQVGRRRTEPPLARSLKHRLELGRERGHHRNEVGVDAAVGHV